MRVVLLGAGGWGARVLAGLQHDPDVQVVGVVEPDAVRANIVRTLAHDVKLVQSLGDLGELDYEAGIVCTPPVLHYDQTRKLLQLGKHVWVEKPMCVRTVEAREVERLSRRLGLTVFVDHLMLYAPGVRELKRQLGSVVLPWSMHFERTNMGTVRTQENVLWSLGAHDVAMALYLYGGLPDAVWCSGSGTVTERWDTVQGGMEWNDMGTATFRLSWFWPEKARRVTVSSPYLVMEYDDTRHALRRWQVHWTDGQPVLHPVEVVTTPKVRPLEEAVRAFVRAPSEGSLSGARQGAQTVAVLEALDRSLSKGGERMEVQS